MHSTEKKGCAHKTCSHLQPVFNFPPFYTGCTGLLYVDLPARVVPSELLAPSTLQLCLGKRHKSLLQEMVLLPWQSPARRGPGPRLRTGSCPSFSAARQLKEKQAHSVNFCLQNRKLEKARWKTNTGGISGKN